jgi:Tol biopolymer transport system component
MAAVITALAVMSVGLRGAEAAPRPTGALVFVSDREGMESIYLVNADGSGLRKLVDGGRQPTWSRSGRALAFLLDFKDDSILGSSTRLVVLDADGSGRPRPVGNRPYCCSTLTWSPDESRIAYEAIADAGIYVTNVDGSGERLLVKGIAWEPTWSPDGSRIAFIRRRDGRDQLAVIDADGTNERRVATEIDFTVRPAWSPDGTTILFGRWEPSNARNLYVVGSDGAGERKLTATRIDNNFPAQWSPDGRLVAFVGLTKSFDDETYVVRADGSGLRRLDKGGAATSWSPDGTLLAGVRNGDIFTLAVDNGKRRRVTQAERYGYENSSPQWHPRDARSQQLGGVPVSAAIPTDTIATRGLLRTRERVDELAADGERVVVATAGRLELWHPRRGTLMPFPGEGGLLELALGGSRLAWLNEDEGTHHYFNLLTATLAQRRPRGVLSRAFGGDTCLPRPSLLCSFIGDLRGGGGIVVFDTWQCSPSRHFKRCPGKKINGMLWRTQGKGAKRIRSERVGLTTLATNEGRIAVLRSNGKLALLRPDGRSLGTVDVPGPARGAAIGNGRLVVLTPTRLLVYELATRTLQHGWPLSRGVGTRTLVGVGGGFAAYTEAHTIKLVRLIDGRRRAIPVPGTGAIRAALTGGGLFYAYAVRDGEYRSRVAYVRLGDLSHA